MESLGLVTREADAHDRRVTRLRITPAGNELMEQNRARRNEWLQQQMAQLSADEIAQLQAAAGILLKLTELPDLTS